MEKFYFTYGTDRGYPFRGGWTIINAPNIEAAIKMFQAIHPSRPGSNCLNCADYYTAEKFEKTDCFKTGNFGEYCHEEISVNIEGGKK